MSLHLLVYELGSALLTTPETTQHITGNIVERETEAASSYSYTKPRPGLTGGWTQLVATLGRTAPTAHLISAPASQAGRGGAEDAATLTHTPPRPDMRAMFSYGVESTTPLLSHISLFYWRMFHAHTDFMDLSNIYYLHTKIITLFHEDWPSIQVCFLGAPQLAPIHQCLIYL